MDHPADWELTLACGADEPGRCTFSDRLYERFDVRWERLTYAPNLELVLDKHRVERDENIAITKLAGVDPQWQGLVRKSTEATVVHAVRLFKDQRLLAQAAIIWPQRRNLELEQALLEGVRPADAPQASQSWQALGISMTIPGEFDLSRNAAKVGRVTWHFKTARQNGPQIVVERLAMPEYWLTTSLGDWLAGQLPPRQKILTQGPANHASHRGWQLISTGSAGTLSALRGIRRLRLDVAWQCPTERRVYHVSQVELTRGQDIGLPDGFSVRCCRPAPVADACTP